MIILKKNKMQFDRHVWGTTYRNFCKVWKSNINLRSRWLNKHIVVDSSFIIRGYSDKNYAKKVKNKIKYLLEPS